MTLRERLSGRGGSSLVEFAIVSVQLFIVMFAMFEFARALIVYNTVANAARVGARYAIVHGSTTNGTGVDGPSGPGSNPTNVVNVVKDYAKPGLLDLNSLTVTVTYPDASNNPGSRVSVKAVYLYDPFTILPLHMSLGTTTQGIITF